MSTAYGIIKVKVRGESDPPLVLTFTNQGVYLDTLFHLQYRSSYTIEDAFWGYKVMSSFGEAMDLVEAMGRDTK